MNLCIVSTGCATMVNGTTDEVNIHAVKSDVQTSCSLILDDEIKGQWEQNGQLESFELERSSDDIRIECISENNKKTKYKVEPKFDDDFLVLDLLVDLCIISCPIDLITGAFYDYPKTITVEATEDLENITSIH